MSHELTTGMRVAMGETCECGHWSKGGPGNRHEDHQKQMAYADELLHTHGIVLKFCSRCNHEDGEHAPVCEVGIKDGRMCGCDGTA